MVQIIPGVLPTTEEEYQRELSRLEKVGLFEWVHIDFMDNKFVPNQGIDPSVMAKYKFNIKKEAHLMVQNPQDWIDQLVKASFKRVLFHMEADGNVVDCLRFAKEKGLEAGLVLKHETSLEKIEPFINKLDVVLLMSVVPGFQGQPFIEEVFDKIREAAKLRLANNGNFKIGADGAVRDTNIKQLVEAGADYVISGSYLLKGNMEENLERMWEVISGS